MSEYYSTDPEYIASLPETIVNAGEHTYRTRIDEKNSIGYILDHNGNWNGNYIRIQREIQEEPSDREDWDYAEDMQDDIQDSPDSEVNPPPDEDQLDENDDLIQSDNPDDKADDITNKKNKRKFKVAIICVCAVLVIGVFFAIQVRNKIESIQSQNTSSSQSSQEAMAESESAPIADEATAPVQIHEDTDSDEGKYVITAAQDILPGTLLSEDLFVKDEISISEYRHAAMSGGLYLWDDIGSISETMYSSTFIPAGCFINYDNVAAAYQPENPWKVADASALTLDIPVAITSENVQNYCFGKTLSLKVTISAQASLSGETDETQPLTGDGIRQENSVVEAKTVSTYAITNIKVIDLLNKNGESLFRPCMIFADVPAVYTERVISDQYQNEKLAQTHKPATIRVLVTQDQMNVLSKIDWSKSEIELTASALAEGTDFQRETSNQINAILPIMMRAIENSQAAD